MTPLGFCGAIEASAGFHKLTGFDWKTLTDAVLQIQDDVKRCSIYFQTSLLHRPCTCQLPVFSKPRHVFRGLGAAGSGATARLEVPVPARSASRKSTILQPFFRAERTLRTGIRRDPTPACRARAIGWRCQQSFVRLQHRKRTEYHRTPARPPPYRARWMCVRTTETPWQTTTGRTRASRTDDSGAREIRTNRCARMPRETSPSRRRWVRRFRGRMSSTIDQWDPHSPRVRACIPHPRQRRRGRGNSADVRRGQPRIRTLSRAVGRRRVAGHATRQRDQRIPAGGLRAQRGAFHVLSRWFAQHLPVVHDMPATQEGIGHLRGHVEALEGRVFL